MRYTSILSVFCVVITSLFAWTPAPKNEPMKLYNQIGKNQAPNILSKSEKSKGWKLLFDGKNTSGWHGYNLKEFPSCWKIEDDAFTTTTTSMGEDQDIITNKIYKNFALSLDFKMAKATNSGIIFQVKEDPKYKYPYETGPEFQIIDQANWPDPLKDWQVCGANYAMYPPKALPCKPIGEWNHLMLIVDGKHVTQMLNGVIVVHYQKNSQEWKKLRDSGKWAKFPDYGKFDEGNISLQNHGTKIWFRNIKIKEL